jgi:septal ring factor EnvC (AmiA/AmiB activator)
MTDSLFVRRLATTVGVVLVIVLALGAIRAAAAWTASAAPLPVAPVSATELRARLVDEQARSAALLDQLATLDGRSRDLASALEQASARITADADHAKDLAAQLQSAKRKLAKLEAAVSKARAAVAASAPVRTAGRTVVVTRSASHDDEHEDDEHDGD